MLSKSIFITLPFIILFPSNYKNNSHSSKNSSRVLKPCFRPGLGPRTLRPIEETQDSSHSAEEEKGLLGGVELLCPRSHSTPVAGQASRLPPHPLPGCPVSMVGPPLFQAHASREASATCSASGWPLLPSILQNSPVWRPESPALRNGSLLGDEELTVSSSAVIPSDSLWKFDRGSPEQCVSPRGVTMASRSSDGGQTPMEGPRLVPAPLSVPFASHSTSRGLSAYALGRCDAGQSVACPFAVCK